MTLEHDSDTLSHVPDGQGASRRALVRAAGAAALSSAIASRATAASAQVGSGPHRRAGPAPAGELRFLVDRITNGWSSAEWARAESLGYSAYLEEQLNPAAIAENPALLGLLAPFTTLGMTSKQLYDAYFGPGATLFGGTVLDELEEAAILRGALSNRQLFERMVEFWTDHFNVTHGDGQVRWLKTTEDRDVIRVHALGNFRDLLGADAKSAAMLFYLDNYRNFASAPNENYARELMELHTLGVGNYTENDVREVARCFTGWQYWNQNAANHGDFRYNAAQHDNGSKTLLGVSIPANGGQQDGETVLTILATHPATAQFIALKLLRWFVTPNPPQRVVDSVAQVFLATGGDIPSVLRAVFDPASVIQVPAGSKPKIRRPFHLATSLLRSTNPTILSVRSILTQLDAMGHRPMSWPAPNGYPDSNEVWGQSVLARWTFVTAYAGGTTAGVAWNPTTLFGSTPKSKLATRAAEVLLGGVIAPEDLAAAEAYANAAPTLDDSLRREVLALVAQSPSYQYH
jgi:uncharacterized protein (DUF1800 family)